MRIVAFGDIHEYIDALPSLGEELRLADLILVTGDLTRWRGKKTAEKVLQAIQHYNPNILAQVGNTDQWDTNDYLTSLGINLHGQGHRFGNLGIFGAGGSNHTPFYSPTEFSEAEIEMTLMAGYAMVADAPHKLLVSHCPPHDTEVDRLFSGHHVGSTSVRKFIDTYQPNLCISGHIHEAAGKDYLGSTQLLNPGMLVQGGYVTVTYDDDTLQAQLIPNCDARHYSTSPFLPPSL